MKISAAPIELTRCVTAGTEARAPGERTRPAPAPRRKRTAWLGEWTLFFALAALLRIRSRR